MKKILIMLLFGITLTGSVLAVGDIAYLTRGTSYVDDNIVNAITELGYTIDYIDDSDIRSTNFTQYRMMLVPDQRFSDYINDIPVNEVPSLILNTYYMDEWHWVNTGVSQMGSTHILGVDIEDSSTIITDGIPSNFKVYTQKSIPIYFLSKNQVSLYIDKIISTESDHLDAVVAKAEPGTLLKHGYKANARGVFFGITETDYWSPESKKLFQNSIHWLIGNMDLDKDGFFAYIDCDDNDPLVHPGAQEIPYDGQDNDCKDGDLTDIDDDGYDSEVVGGDDCNDYNPEYNPGSTDPLKDCINEAPILSEEIPDLEWDEDEFYLIDLDNFFSDIDNDFLYYTIYDTSDNEDVSVSFLGGGVVVFETTENWNGKDWIIFSGSDGEFQVESNKIEISVLPVNDAPVMEKIHDMIVNENDPITLEVIATDPESDTIEYSIDNPRFTYEGDGVFSWQTDYGDSGVYTIEITVSDFELSNSQNLDIIVKDYNEPPTIDQTDITIKEDSGLNTYGKISASDANGIIVDYEVLEEDLERVDCRFNEDVLELTPASDFKGVSSCLIRVYDNDGAYTDATINIIVENINDSPEIISISPSSDPLTTEYGVVEFEIGWEDVDLDEVTIEWYKDGDLDGEGESYTFVGDGTVGQIEIEVIIDDEELSDSFEWLITATDIPIANTYEGNTTDFSGMTDAELNSVNLVLERESYGKIEFIDPIDLREVADLDTNSDIQNGYCSVNSNKYPEFKGKDARITFYDLIFDKTPTIYYTNGFSLEGDDREICPESICSEINYQNNILTFVVTSFSSFMVGDTLSCSEQRGDICETNEVCLGSVLESRDTDSCCSIKCVPEFSDVDTCNSPHNKIEIKIKDPDDGDDFEIGETIDVEVEVENNFKEDLDFDVEAHLYDLDEDESVEEADEDTEIDEGEDEKFEFQLEIPDDVSENSFAIYIYVEDEEGRCNSDYVEIEIERQKHKVVIDEFNLPSEASPGDIVDARIKVENLGSNDEDVVIKVENIKLNISERTEEFELEEYDEDDTETKTILIKIPDDAQEGDYVITARVDYGSRSDSTAKTITISGKPKPKAPVIIPEGELITLGQEQTSVSTEEPSGEPLMLIETDRAKAITAEKDLKPEVTTKVGEYKPEPKESGLDVTPDDEKKDIRELLGNPLILVTIIIGIVILIILIAIVYVLRSNP